MQTIKGIRDQIQKNQARIDAENRAAQQERDKADQYRGDKNIVQAQAHTNTAMQHEQNSLQFQNEIADLMKVEQQLQAQITGLDQQKTQVVTSKDTELSAIDSQIDRLSGGA
jgi:predicted  nucleic acid-binding Zn-ribbon protein